MFTIISLLLTTVSLSSVTKNMFTLQSPMVSFEYVTVWSLFLMGKQTVMFSYTHNETRLRQSTFAFAHINKQGHMLGGGLQSVNLIKIRQKSQGLVSLPTNLT